MNSEEAKDILQLCRPGHAEEDLEDPLVREAFEKLEQDSELCAWFEEQQMVDAAICEELKSILPSPDLKASILSGMQERAATSNRNQENTSRVEDHSDKAVAPNYAPANSDSKIVWFRPVIGIAAALLFASVLLILSRKEPTLQKVADKSLPANELALSSSPAVAGIPDIVQFLSQQLADFDGSKLEKRSEQINELQSYLKLTGMPSPAEIPKHFEAAPTIGCVAFDYGGTQLSMICFKNGQVYHLFTMNKADLNKDSLPNYFPSKPEVFEHKKQAFKVWSKGDQIYILSVQGTEKDLPEFI